MSLLEVIAVDPYVRATTVFVLFFALSSGAYFFLQYLITRFLEYTEHSWDKETLSSLKKPASFLILLVGIYYSLVQIPIFETIRPTLANVFFAIIVIVCAYIFSRISSIVIQHHIAVSTTHRGTPRLLNLVVSILIFTVAIIMILQQFNVKITAIIATLGIGGLAVGLALQDTLANLFAGLHLITAKPIRVGDYIELDNGLQGYVQDITWRSTRVRQIPDNIIVIPNRKLADSILVNDSMPQEQLLCLVECGVSYESDLSHVEEVTLKTAKKAQEELSGCVRGFEPYMRFTAFSDSNINFNLYLRVHSYIDKIAVTHEFIKRLKHAFDQENIEISWPVRKVYHHNTNEVHKT